MKKFNPAHAQAIMELLADSPFYNTIHMNITDISEGYARLELDVTKQHHNPFGGIHGGVLATLLDTPPTGRSTLTLPKIRVTSRSICC